MKIARHASEAKLLIREVTKTRLREARDLLTFRKNGERISGVVSDERGAKLIPKPLCSKVKSRRGIALTMPTAVSRQRRIAQLVHYLNYAPYYMPWLLAAPRRPSKGNCAIVVQRSCCAAPRWNVATRRYVVITIGRYLSRMHSEMKTKYLLIN